MTKSKIEKSEVIEAKTNSGEEGNAKVLKPEFLPEKFWDSEKENIRLEEMTKSYKSLEQKLSSISQELRDLKEANGKEQPQPEDKNLLKGEVLPSSPEEYLKELNFDLISISPEINEILFKAKYSVEQVKTFYNIMEQFLMPEIVDLYNDMKSLNDLEKLETYFGGESKFATISRQLNSWAKKSLEAKTYHSLSRSFQGVIAMYKMMQEETEKTASSINSSSNLYRTTKEEKEKDLKEMMKNPSYWRDKNPEYRSKVERGFKELYPE